MALERQAKAVFDRDGNSDIVSASMFYKASNENTEYSFAVTVSRKEALRMGLSVEDACDTKALEFYSKWMASQAMSCCEEAVASKVLDQSNPYIPPPPKPEITPKEEVLVSVDPIPLVYVDPDAPKEEEII